MKKTGGTVSQSTLDRDALTPEEREQKLKQWLQKKELLDKGLEVC